MIKSVRFSSLAIAAVALVGCQSTGSSTAYNAAGSNGYYAQQQQQPAMQNQIPSQPQVQSSAGMYGQAESASMQMSVRLAGELSSLNERMRRVENAMIRLDRRMKILERNELARISGGMMQGEKTPALKQGGFQPMSFKDQSSQNTQQRYMAPASQPLMQQRQDTRTYGRGAGYQPVSYSGSSANDGLITSSLGVAPTRTSKMHQAESSSYGLPSLADKSHEPEKASVSIWTVNYEQGKIWPERNQLLSSRKVVESIKSEKPVAIYARGANPASKEFRERVRALSKYLSKVTSKTSLPISSMPSEHLSGDVIEIITTR